MTKRIDDMGAIQFVKAFLWTLLAIAVVFGVVVGVGRLNQAAKDDLPDAGRPLPLQAETDETPPRNDVTPTTAMQRPETPVTLPVLDQRDRSGEVEVERVAPVLEADEEKPGFIVSAMIRGSGGRVTVGIVDKETGQGRMLRDGDLAGHGWRLVSVDFNNETAVFEKDGRQHTALMDQSASLSALTPDARDVERLEPPRVSDVEPATPPPTGGVREPRVVFTNRVYQIEGFQPVAVSEVAGNPDFIQIKTGGDNYALRREVAEKILSLERVTTEDKLWMMVSYPGLADVRPGDDPVKQAMNAESDLTEKLVPPEGTPDLEELQRLIEENQARMSPPPKRAD